MARQPHDDGVSFYADMELNPGKGVGTLGIPGIYQLRIPIGGSPLGGILCYLIRGDEGHILVDTGWNTPNTFATVKRQLEEIDVAFEDIAFIVITHAHADHYGLAGRIKHLSQAKVVIHELDKPPFTSWPVFPPPGKADSIKGWLMQQGMSEDDIAGLQIPGVAGYEPTIIEPDVAVRGGETVSQGSSALEVIWTPGHSAGHICLYHRKRKVLFTGDHLLPGITPNIGLRPPKTGNPLRDYLASLEKMKNLDVELVLPAHEHAFGNFRKRVEEIQQHHAVRLEAVLNTLKSGPRTTYEITAGVPWDIGLWHNLTMWDRYLALGEALAHLVFLSEQGKVRRSTRDSTFLWQLA